MGDSGIGNARRDLMTDAIFGDCRSGILGIHATRRAIDGAATVVVSKHMRDALAAEPQNHVCEGEVDDLVTGCRGQLV
jgi:DNA-binding FrmR family transcriptional regulator